MLTVTPCPLCKGTQKEITEYHGTLRYDYPAKVYKCTACTFTFLHPRLDVEAQQAYYTTEYRADYEDVSIEERFIIDSPEAAIRLEKIKASSPSITALLEIGSGSGAFLSLATREFNTAIGIELDQNAHQFFHKKNLTVYSSLEELKDQKFDTIIMFHVLEHLLDPVAFLQQLATFLTPNGQIIIEVPNVDDALVSFYDIHPFKDFYFCSAHVSYFSPQTLLDCIERAHLKGEILFRQRYDLHNHLNWLMHQKPGTLTGTKKIFSADTCAEYAADLQAKGMSDTLWAIAKKAS